MTDQPSKLPYFYPFSFGEGKVTVLSDGPLALGDPRDNFQGVSPATIVEMLDRNFLPTDDVVLEQNVPLVEINGRTILFDTGMGDSKIFGPTTGRLINSLSEAGRKPEEVDTIVLSHAHIDHIGGIANAEGDLLFPNAEIWISERDFHDWTTGENIRPGFEVQIQMAQRNLAPHGDRVFFYSDEQEFLPGVHAMHTPGHTMGHHCFVIESGDDRFCFLGDLTHHHVLLMERPLMEFKYDADPALSARSRQRMLGMLAHNRIQVMSYHYAWPGLGHVASEGEGFRYNPQPIEMLA